MMIEEIEMNIGDLVIATDASFEGDMALSVGTPGLVKEVGAVEVVSPVKK